MKYGVLMHTTTMNLGDDIQSYALAQFLPHIDYICTRENLDKFVSKDNEPVGVIMSAWWMWEKWNWPPARCIYPLLTSMHVNTYTIKRKASPIKEEWLQGIGGDYFKAYGPIGCRDYTTLDYFKKLGFDAYFSGCITLTLPKQPKTKDAGEYVCIVDLDAKLEEKVRELLKPTGLKIRKLTHHCDYRKSDATLEQRFSTVVDTLTTYQNARCVITRRLHVSLPCLAMEAPVICIVDMKDKGNETRWAPYYDWMHKADRNDVLAGKIDYDFLNPPKNKTLHLDTRNKLAASVTQFVEETKNCKLSTEELVKTTYTYEEQKEWQHQLMHYTLDRWLHLNRGLLSERNQARKKVKKLEKECQVLSDQVEEQSKKIKKLENRSNNRKISGLRKRLGRIKSNLFSK